MMKRPVLFTRVRSDFARPPRGYTLVEILVATTLTLMMMVVVVQLFSRIGTTVNESRATLEMSDRLRAAEARLMLDLEGLTVTMLPPGRVDANPGYFELIEGPVGPVVSPQDFAVNSDPGAVDPYDSNLSPPRDFTVGDMDVLMFTAHGIGRPFVGKYWDPVTNSPSTIESDLAEIAWFVRGRTLYRRVMLIAPGVNLSGVAPGGFFAEYDISVRNEGGTLIANTLGDLTKREWRYAHQSGNFPFDARAWGQLGLPTLRECSSAAWVAGGTPPIWKSANQIDFWNEPHPWDNCDPTTGTLTAYMGPRIAEDVILTNVIGFDVKVWDPAAPIVLDDSGTTGLAPGHPDYLDALEAGNSRIGYGAYVDLNYMCLLGPETTSPVDPSAPEPKYRDVVLSTGEPEPHFYGAGRPRSGLRGTEPDTSPPPADVRPSVYDTWSFHYEHDGLDQDGDGVLDQGTDGFDSPPFVCGVDDATERETAPPYPVPLRGLQIKIRVFEPDSRQIREVTVVQDFLPK